MEICHVSEDPKEQGTGTWKEHGTYMILKGTQQDKVQLRTSKAHLFYSELLVEIFYFVQDHLWLAKRS